MIVDTNGFILYIGTLSEARSKGKSYRHHEIDLNGSFVLPGFIDTHVHPVEGGIEATKYDELHISTTFLSLILDTESFYMTRNLAKKFMTLFEIMWKGTKTKNGFLEVAGMYDTGVDDQHD